MDSVETGRSPFFSQLQKEGQRAADLVFTDLDTTSTPSNIEPGLFRASQINTLYGTLPLFVLSHIIVVPTFASVISDQFQTAMTSWWIAFSIVPVALVLLLWTHHARRRSPLPASPKSAGSNYGILFGLSWALFPSGIFCPR